MQTLNEKEWLPFQLDELFSFQRGQENNMSARKGGITPLVSAKANNNGIKDFVSTDRKRIKGNCLTLNNDGDGGAGLSYYQPMNMTLDTHVTALIPKHRRNQNELLFLSACISGLHGFFGHGLSISNKRATKIHVMLPVTNFGEPDYSYMAKYTTKMGGVCLCVIGATSLSNSPIWNTGTSPLCRKRYGRIFPSRSFSLSKQGKD